MAKKKKTGWVKLISTAGTGVFRVAKSSAGKKLELRKYDPKIRKHVSFKESKMK